MLRVFETFASIQANPAGGIPCFFIRLAGCNLSCTYCDTVPSRPLDSGREMELKDVLDLAKASGLKLVEVTGGEPLIHAETPELCKRLLAAGHEVMIETNGSLDTGKLPEKVVRVLDFKTPSSGEAHRMLPANFAKLRPCDEVKFVISGREDYLFALRMIAKFGLDKKTRNLLISPTTGRIQPADIVRWMVEDKAPVRLNLQLHKIIWGPNATGV
jgi:7-carboxy-7-deazaguanine synthase